MSLSLSSIQNENTVQIYGYASVVSGMVNIWCITLLSVERLWVIYWASRVRMVKVHGVILSIFMFLQTLYCYCSSLPQMKMSVIKTITGMFWAVSIVLATLPLLGYGRYVYEVSQGVLQLRCTGW